jgi:ABC-type transport system involved in multi-copper enzyme maturation permease subunit
MSAPSPLPQVAPSRQPWLGRVAVVAVIGAAALLSLAPLQLALLAPVLGALLVWALRRGGRSVVGPLFFYDVVRLARRGRGPALRFVYGGALLAGLAFVYASEFSTSDLFDFSGDRQRIGLGEQARFAQTLVTALLLLQNVAVLALTPAYLAGAVAEEKEKKTLALLFTTALTDREIIVGKMLGRLAHVGGVLLAGLPVLSLALLWGGVDVSFLLAGFAVTALTLLSVGAVCLFCSVMANTVLGATVAAYVLSAVLGFGCLCQGGGFAFSPISFVIELNRRMAEGNPSAGAAPGPADPAGVALELLVYYAVIHGPLILISVATAVSQLRPFEPSLGPRPPDARPAWEDPPAPPIELTDPISPHVASPPVGDDALFWKEVLRGTGSAPPKLSRELALPAVMGLVALVGSWMFTIVYGVTVGVRPDMGWLEVTQLTPLTPLVRIGTIGLLTAVCLVAAFRAAGSVVRERDRRTLDGLLVLPVTRKQILRAKWLGSVLPLRHLLYWVGALWIVAVCSGALHPLALLPLALIAAAHIAFLASLGVWVSVVARNALWANVTMAVLLLLFFGGSWLLWFFAVAGPADDLDPLGEFVLAALNPWRSWWDWVVPPLVSPKVEWVAARGEVFATVAGGMVFALLAAGFWRLAVRDFRRQQGRPA